MSKIGMVLEGGGNRGIYTAGVLDVLVENEVWADGVFGVSAGAVHGCSYVSGQNGRSINYISEYCRDPRYMSFRSLRKTGDLFNTEFCYRLLPEKLYPFDNDAFEASPIDFFAVCTDVESGKAVYHHCESLRGEKVDWIRASASLPMISNIVELDGQKLLDGGIADSIPLEAAQKSGYEHNIVILTRVEGYRKKPNRMAAAIKRAYKQYPQFVETVKNRHVVYNHEVELVEKEAGTGEVCLIRPSEYIKVGRLEKDPQKIRSLYELGRRDGERSLDRVRGFIASAKGE